ncbi:MAG: HAMP domain-containing protein [Salinivirgaceae bacterium]|nr:HAMP domain-containing protein [Salinivirgaceae bacterium]
MTLQQKLLSLVIIPVVLSTTIALVTSSLKISKQGKIDIIDKSNAILSLNIREFIKYHHEGIELYDDKENNYAFRISSKKPENKKYLATNEDVKFIDQFINTGEPEITNINEETNTLMVMRPLYMDHDNSCVDCHELVNQGLGKRDLRGMFVVSTDITPVQKEVKSAIAEITLFGVIISVIAVLIGIFIVRGIILSFQQIINVSNEVADGNLNVVIDINRKDEIGQMANGLSQMLEKLRYSIGEILDETENIANASSHISAASNQLSQSSNTQASAVEEVSASMEEMSANIQQNADNAKETEKISIQAVTEINNSSEALFQTVEAMKHISKKISIITDIASQTNILALNAAVESARAGEHGRGFAVVATEVRTLAEKSSEAASEIINNTNASLGVAENSKKMLQDLVPIIQNNAKLIHEISASSMEQNSGADQINGAIQQINQASQNNAAQAEELTSIAEEMTGLSDKLKKSVSFFKL